MSKVSPFAWTPLAAGESHFSIVDSREAEHYLYTLKVLPCGEGRLRVAVQHADNPNISVYDSRHIPEGELFLFVNAARDALEELMWMLYTACHSDFDAMINHIKESAKCR